jgi:hypothetical protein
MTQGISVDGSVVIGSGVGIPFDNISAAAGGVGQTQTFNTGVAQSFPTLIVSYGYDPITYSLDPFSAELPTGLTFHPSNGYITGTATTTTNGALLFVNASDLYNRTTGNVIMLVVGSNLDTVLEISSRSLVAGTADSFTPVTAAGGVNPLVWSISPALPSGLSLNTSNGLISGTPTVTLSSTSYTVTVTDNASASSNKSFSMVITAPALTTTQVIPARTMYAGVADSFTPVTASGGYSTKTWGVSPAFPSGVSINSGNGLVSGTATALLSATTYTITVTDSLSQTSSKTLSLTVDDNLDTAVAIASRTVTAGTAETGFIPITASGGYGTKTWAISPALPSGLSINSANGSISGNATSTLSSTPFTVTVTDSLSVSSNKQFSLVVAAPAFATTLAIASRTLTAGTADSFTPVTVTSGSTGYGTKTWSIVGTALPNGLSINSTNGLISGTPTVNSGSTSYTVRVTDGLGQTSDKSFSMTVSAPAITTTQAIASRTLTAGTADSFTPVTATGGYSTKTWSISPALPSGLTLTASNGLISGTPTVNTGATTYTVTVTDVLNTSSSKTFSMTINAPALTTTQAITTRTFRTGAVITSYTPVTASGGYGTKTWDISPALPSGLSLNTSNGLISGTPSATSGSTSYTITVTDGLSQTSSKTTTLEIVAVLTTAVNSIPTITEGTAYTAFNPVTASGGTTTKTYSISPSLPAGMSFSTSTGQISGTPTSTGTRSVTTCTVTVIDQCTTPQNVTSSSFTITVRAVAQSVFTTAGTPQTWTVPPGVTSISMVCIGGGGAAGGRMTVSGTVYYGGGGGGGALAYRNNIAVTPGSTVTINVGIAGTGTRTSTSYSNGGQSNVTVSGTVVCAAGGGISAITTTSNTGNGGLGGTVSVGTGFAGGKGGNGNQVVIPGGAGGGGAGGYAGVGGLGGNVFADGSFVAGGSGAGGGGGGGAGGYWPGAAGPGNGGGGGGGTGLLGQGSSGAGGLATSSTNGGGRGGSGGDNGASAAGGVDPDGGLYGGGGAGPIGDGARGAVRIMWPGDTRSYPSTSVANAFY